MTSFRPRHSRHGFTLIELSIALVIIGLVVGGVLVGQDLIKAAGVRAQVSQIEKLKTSVNTFRIKYGHLPGDIPSSTAIAFGLPAGTGAAGHGDGNGSVESCSAGSGVILGCEMLLFWTHLSQAQLIEGSFSAGGSFPDSAVTTGINAAAVAQYLPRAAIGRENYLFNALVSNRINFFALSGVTAVDAAGAYTRSLNIAPQDAMNIDVKIDDGLPTTGNVGAIIIIPPNISTVSAGLDLSFLGSPGLGCITNGLTGPMVNSYNLSSTASSAICGMVFKF